MTDILTQDALDQIRARHRVITECGTNAKLAGGDVDALLGDVARLLAEVDWLRTEEDDRQTMERIIKRLHDERDAAVARAEKLEKALREQHNWHQQAGEFHLPDGNGGFVELDHGTEYADSAMCERTIEALS